MPNAGTSDTMASQDRILLLSQDTAIRNLVHGALQEAGCSVVEVETPQMLRSLLQRGVCLVVLDLELTGMEIEQAAAVLREYREMPVLLMTADTAAARRGLEQWRESGAELALEELIARHVQADRLRRQVQELREKGRFLKGSEIIGQSQAIRRLRERILRVAATPVSTVLLIGESGAGKDLVAEAVHRYSDRASAPFVPINCAAIPENLLESELFGHERGAFTDAKSQRRGLFEQADGGTVFLDEVGEMSQAAQIRLLRVLEQRQVTRVGSSEALPVDIRVIAATNKDLQEAVAQREFRLDLYHRLKVVDLQIPPLRDRPEDIPVLIDHFVEQFGGSKAIRFQGFTQQAMDLLLDYDWPGNVRELRNLIEHLAFLGPRRPVEPQDLVPHLERPPAMDRHLPVPTGKTPDQSERELIYFALLDLKREVAEMRRMLEEQGNRSPAPPSPVYQLEAPGESPDDHELDQGKAVEPLRTLKELEKEAIEKALARVGGNRKQAAGILGISPRTLYRKLDEYGLR